jgi:hypothetical protein
LVTIRLEAFGGYLISKDICVRDFPYAYHLSFFKDLACSLHRLKEPEDILDIKPQKARFEYKGRNDGNVHIYEFTGIE